jgi:DNA repair exonuclease SbcCD nuclease subunit
LKIVHAADLHLDSPLCGLERYEGAPVARIRGATRRALENLIALCLEEQAALLLIAGDLYDGNWKDYSTGLFFASQMARLRAGGTRVVFIRGNHDAASQLTKSLRLPENVRELDTRRPETVIFEDLGVAVHGQGFATRAVTDDLAARYPPRLPDLLNVGLLHTSAGGREGHENYAPCQIETLIAKGYDYWALGHVHRREVLCDSPWIVFPGNLQGRQARETGAKGATLITAEDARITAVEHRALDVVRWCTRDVDVTGSSSTDEVIDEVRRALQTLAAAGEGRTLAVRLRITGTTAAHAALIGELEQHENEIRAAATDVSDALWLERLEVRTQTPIDLDRLAQRDDAAGRFVRSVRALHDDEAALALLLDAFADLQRKLPQEAREGDDAIQLDDTSAIRKLLGDVEQMLVPMLFAEDPSP